MVNIDQWLPRWKKRTEELNRKINKTPGEVAQYGKLTAKQIAPRDTGSLINAISYKTTPGNKESKAQIYVKGLQNPKYPGRRGYVPRYALIQHQMSLGARSQAKTGDPHWLFTITGLLRRKFRSDVQAHITNFKRG